MNGMPGQPGNRSACCPGRDLIVWTWRRRRFGIGSIPFYIIDNCPSDNSRCAANRRARSRTARHGAEQRARAGPYGTAAQHSLLGRVHPRTAGQQKSQCKDRQKFRDIIHSTPPAKGSWFTANGLTWLHKDKYLPFRVKYIYLPARYCEPNDRARIKYMKSLSYGIARCNVRQSIRPGSAGEVGRKVFFAYFSTRLFAILGAPRNP